MRSPFESVLADPLIPGRDARQLGRMLLVFGTLGVLSGVIAWAFVTLVEATGDLFLVATVGLDPSTSRIDPSQVFVLPHGAGWLVVVVPTVGGLLSGWLCARYCPEAMGTGTGAVIDAYHRRGGRVRRRAPLVKAVASALTIGSGGSAGVEGPIGFIAAGVGSGLADAFRLSSKERRVLLMSGFAAGIGAVFHAPMAASVFAAEVLYRELDLEVEVLVGAIIASTVAYATFGAVHGWNPVWEVPAVEFGGPLELGPYLVLAFVCAAGGAAFVRLHHALGQTIGRAQSVPLWIRPGIGGLGVGLVGLVLPSAMGVGGGMAQAAIDGQLAITTLVVLAGAKMVTSSLTAASGGSGGLFAPSLVIGATLGGLTAATTQLALPDLGVQSAAFAVVGMAGFFAAVINAPLSTVIMVSEVVGSYRLLVPTLWVCALSWFLLRRSGLYSEQVASRFEAPGHVADMMGAVLRRLKVRDALDPEVGKAVTIAPETSLQELVQVFGRTVQGVFPIVGTDGRVLGVVDGRELRRTIGEVGLDAVMIAQDFRTAAVSVTLDQALDAVVRRMTTTGYDELLVVDGQDASQFVGVISRRAIVAAYHRSMLERQQKTGSYPAIGTDEASLPAPAASAAEQLLAAVDRGGVLVDVDATTSDEALAAMLGETALPATCDRDRLLDAVRDRERLGSTNLGHGIALPHPAVESVKDFIDPFVIVGLLRRPIRWELPDSPAADPVTTVVILLSPASPVHLALLGMLARVLSDPEVRDLLVRRASGRRILAGFRAAVARAAA